MKTKKFLLPILLCLCFALSACAQKQVPAPDSTDAPSAPTQTDNPIEAPTESATATELAKFNAVTADSDGNIVLPTDGITTSAVFFNYDADGIIVQLMALCDENGKVHIAFNTCQSCSPSPKAYYTQQGDVLQCANCGFTFASEEVGVVKGGCNPWPIEEAVFENDRILIPASALDEMRDTFVSWQGPTE